jgi:hypothetical protein
MRALLIILAAMLAGCATAPKVQIHPPERKGEWHGYLNEAEAALGMELEAESVASFVAATHYPNGKAAIIMPLSGGRLVGGWTTYNGKRAKSVLATNRDGRVGPGIGRHEAGRAVLYSNGIHSDPEQERRLKEVGLW